MKNKENKNTKISEERERQSYSEYAKQSLNKNYFKRLRMTYNYEKMRSPEVHLSYSHTKTLPQTQRDELIIVF